jgi:IclR family transcriptional regulator, acetate operon repressor
MPRNGVTKEGASEVTGPRSLTRLLGLFDVLAKSKDGLTLAELNQALQSPKSSLLNLLRPLVIDGFLAVDSGRYRLGPSIFRLAANIMSVWNFSSTMRPYLEELAERSGESVYLGVLDTVGSVITYVDAIESMKAVRFSVPVGAVRPLYSTAAGRVLLAFGDPDWVDNYLRNTKIAAYTPYTVTSRKALREELEQIRKTRISVSMGETFPESGAIAAPIFGADGKLIAAIAIGAPVSRLEPELADLRPIISDIASRASGSTRSMLRASAAAALAESKRAPAVVIKKKASAR